MKKERYQEIVKKHKPNEHKGKNILVVFFVGGLMGLLAQGLIDLYQKCFSLSGVDAATLMIVTIIFISCLLTAFGVFDNLVNVGKMGLILPISGFAQSVQSAILDFKKEGPIFGFGSNAFKLAGSVLLYGITAGVIISIIRFLLGGIL